MEKTSPPRTLIILWRWEELQEKDISHDEIFVSNDPNANIIRVNERKKESFPEIFTEILRDKSENSVILIFHTSAIDNKQWQRIYPQLDKEYSKKIVTSPIFFGGGKNFIYYDCERDSGLINAEGGFVINEPYSPEGWDRRVQVSVVEYPEHDTASYTIQKKYFDRVWDYYKYRPKKHLFEFKENLYIHLTGLKAMQQQITLPEFLQGHPFYKEFLNIMHISDFYQSAENMETARTHYNELMRFMKEEHFSDTYLENLRNRFSNLFKATSELINYGG